MLNTLTFRALFTLCATVSTFSSAAYFEGMAPPTRSVESAMATHCTYELRALNNEQWNNLGNCGRCAQVSCIDEACADQTASAIVQIVDRCPECKYGDLDLSPSVFKTSPVQIQADYRSDGICGLSKPRDRQNLV
ncbi:RlpA-like double-psi beta-barrel domain [Phytophthora cactorum]|nr:RlpA-like double-psi beta-barrel domain [Phytophthora cactorum]